MRSGVMLFTLPRHTPVSARPTRGHCRGAGVGPAASYTPPQITASMSTPGTTLGPWAERQPPSRRNRPEPAYLRPEDALIYETDDLESDPHASRSQ